MLLTMSTKSNFIIELTLFDKTCMEEILPYRVVGCSQLLKFKL